MRTVPPLAGIAAMAAFTFAPISAPGIPRGSMMSPGMPPEAVPFDANCAIAAVANKANQTVSAEWSGLML